MTSLETDPNNNNGKCITTPKNGGLSADDRDVYTQVYLHPPYQSYYGTPPSKLHCILLSLRSNTVQYIICSPTTYLVTDLNFGNKPQLTTHQTV